MADTVKTNPQIKNNDSKKIRLFSFLQKIYQNIGISPPQFNQNHNPFNLKNCLIPFCLTQFLITSAAYLLFEANSMIEYGRTSFTCTTLVFCSVIYSMLFWQMETILNYIGNCEEFIEKSESLSLAIMSGFELF